MRAYHALIVPGVGGEFWCQSWEKVEFILAIRQPQLPTNFCFPRENGHTSIHETYCNTSSSCGLSPFAIIRERHLVAEEQWVAKAGVLLDFTV